MMMPTPCVGPSFRVPMSGRSLAMGTCGFCHLAMSFLCRFAATLVARIRERVPDNLTRVAFHLFRPVSGRMVLSSLRLVPLRRLTFAKRRLLGGCAEVPNLFGREARAPRVTPFLAFLARVGDDALPLSLSHRLSLPFPGADYSTIECGIIAITRS